MQSDSPAAQFESLVAGLESRMIRAIARVVDDPDDADDALQNALTTIWRKRTRLLRHPNREAVVLRVCIDAAYDLLRNRRRANRLVVAAPADGVPDRSASALERLSASEARQRLLNAVLELPRNQSLAIHLRYVEELSYPQIAAAIGCAESTTRKHVERGLSRLRQLAPT